MQVDRIHTCSVLLLTSQKSSVFYFLSATHRLVWHVLLHFFLLSCQLTFVCNLIVVTTHKQNFVKEKYLELYDLQSRHYKAHTENVIG